MTQAEKKLTDKITETHETCEKGSYKSKWLLATECK